MNTNHEEHYRNRRLVWSRDLAEEILQLESIGPDVRSIYYTDAEVKLAKIYARNSAMGVAQ